MQGFLNHMRPCKTTLPFLWFLRFLIHLPKHSCFGEILMLWHIVLYDTMYLVSQLFFSFKGNNQIDRESITQIYSMIGMFMPLQGMVGRIKACDLRSGEVL